MVRAGQGVVVIVSERDDARKVILLGRASRETRVRDGMGALVITASIDDTVATRLARMTEHRVRHRPVLDDDRQGVVPDDERRAHPNGG